MKTEKTNIDYLKEFMKDNDEAIEFLDAVMEEIKEKDDEIEDLRNKNCDLEFELDNLKDEVKDLMDNKSDLEKIDCGIGVVEFVMPENLQLSMIMESLQDNPKKLFELQ